MTEALFVVKVKGTGLYWAKESHLGGSGMTAIFSEARVYPASRLTHIAGDPNYEQIPVGLNAPLPSGDEGKRDRGDLMRVARDAPLAGKKYDAGKAPIWQGFENYFANSILGVAWVSEYGDRKYVRDGSEHYSQNWAQVENGKGRYKDAEGRHRLEPARGHDYDEESGLSHLQQKAWNAMADLERAVRDGRIKLMRGNEIDANGKPIPGTAKEIS